MSRGLLGLILDQIFDAEWRGEYGEKLTERELKIVQLFGRKGKTLRNIYLPKENGETSEVDVVFITQKGIFVLESKNYSGWIFGDEKSQYWTAMLPNQEKNRFYNPIKQNRTHLKWMRKYAGEEIPLFSIIVFSERCELKKIQVDSDDIKVIKRNHTYATIAKIWESNPDALSEDQVTELYEKLKILTDVDQAVKESHINDIKKKYDPQPKKPGVPEVKKEPDVATVQESISQNKMTCPRCGGELVLRTAKSGAHAGKQFYGCSNFPKCRYVQNQ